MAFTIDDAKSAAIQLNVEFTDFSLKDLLTGMNVELEHKDITNGDPIKSAEIALAHLKEDGKYYEKLAKMEEKQNAKDWAKVYVAKTIEQGVCEYETETILLKNDALHQMSHTFKGRPVIYKDYQHDSVNPENMEEKAVGYVAECYYNELSGDFWTKFIVFDDTAKDAIKLSPYVSCAYVGTEFGQGGTWHNVAYDREILNGEFTHLAIVAKPRYEDAKIYENSKQKKEIAPMFKIFQKKEENKELKNAVVEIDNKGQKEEVSLSDLVKNYQNTQEEEKKEKLNGEDEIDIDGKKVSVNALINCYKKANAMTNAEDEEEDDDEEKKNAEEEEKKKEEEEKQNAKKVFSNNIDLIKKEQSNQIVEIGSVWSDKKGLEDGKQAFSI